jgi:hypothetical protein
MYIFIFAFLESNCKAIDSATKDSKHSLTSVLQELSFRLVQASFEPKLNQKSRPSYASCLHHLWRCKRQGVPKLRHIKYRRLGITQQKEYNKYRHFITCNILGSHGCVVECSNLMSYCAVKIGKYLPIDRARY